MQGPLFPTNRCGLCAVAQLSFSKNTRLMNSTVFVAMLVIEGIVLIVSTLVLVSRKQTRNRLAAMRAGYQQLLLQHGLTPTAEQEYSHRILGLDAMRKVLVAYLPASETGHLVLPLSEVSDCSVRKEGIALRQGRHAGVTEEHVNGISLSLRLYDGRAVDVPIWSEVLDGLEEKTVMHKAALTWQHRIHIALGRAVAA